MVSVAFRAKRPMNYEVFRPLHRRLLEDERIRVVLYGKSQGASSTRLFEDVGALPGTRRPNWRAKFARPDVLISCDWLLATKHARATVQIFHGISGKGHNLNPMVRDYSHVFVIGPWLQRRLIARGLVDAGDPRLLPVGMPKTDKLTDGTLDRAATLRALGLDPSRPVVLYAPSWGGESSLEHDGERILAELGRLQAQVIVKPHDNSYDPRYAKADWRSVLARLERPGFTTPNVYDVVPPLPTDDLLVTDLSSVSLESLHVDRPAVFLTFPGQLDARAELVDVDTWRNKMGILCGEVADLGSIIAAELADPGRLAPVRRAALHDVYYNPGHATDAAMVQLYRVFELDPPARTAAPARARVAQE